MELTKIQEKELQEVLRLKEFEKEIQSEYKYVAGVDEAGRGPLAGPVVVAAVIMPKDSKILGIRDSKRISEKKRNKLYDIIRKEALSYSIIEIGPEKIDEINILAATKLACKKVIESLSITPDMVLIDALDKIDVNLPVISIIKGDDNSYSIACASILAKVYRDRKMIEYSKKYPEFGLEKHKGYGTKKHYEALENYGITKIHRKSFIHKNYSKYIESSESEI